MRRDAAALARVTEFSACRRPYKRRQNARLQKKRAQTSERQQLSAANDGKRARKLESGKKKKQLIARTMLLDR